MSCGMRTASGPRGSPRARRKRSTRCPCSGFRTACACVGTTPSTHSGLSGPPPTTATRCCTKRSGRRPRTPSYRTCRQAAATPSSSSPAMTASSTCGLLPCRRSAWLHSGHSSTTRRCTGDTGPWGRPTPRPTSTPGPHRGSHQPRSAASQGRPHTGEYRLRIRKERFSGVAILPQPCLLCGGQEETAVHMHVGCANSRLLWPHYRQAVQEAA